MKSCINCGNNFEEKKPFEKYCTLYCQRRVTWEKRKKKYEENPDLKNENSKKKYEYKKKRLEDPEFKKEYRSKENERKRRRYWGDESHRKSVCESGKRKYRKANEILSDNDLKKAPNGYGCLTKYGYRKIHKKDHPNAWKNGDMFEHVFIMSEKIGRPLRKGETVHHINGIKDDNRVENLQLWSSSHPYGQRVEDKIKWAMEFLELYDFEITKKAKKA